MGNGRVQGPRLDRANGASTTERRRACHSPQTLASQPPRAVRSARRRSRAAWADVCVGGGCVRADDTAQALLVVAEYLEAHPVARHTPDAAPTGEAPDAFDPICSPLLLQVRRHGCVHNLGFHGAKVENTRREHTVRGQLPRVKSAPLTHSDVSCGDAGGPEQEWCGAAASVPCVRRAAAMARLAGDAGATPVPTPLPRQRCTMGAWCDAARWSATFLPDAAAPPVTPSPLAADARR
jgi:hypothetical protein